MAVRDSVILFDHSENANLNFVEEMISRSYHIAVLVVNTDIIAYEVKEKYKDNPHITHILSIQDVEYVDGIEYIEFEYLASFKEAQYKVEFANHRWLNDGMLSSNKFINALFWWKHIFDSFDIRFVLIENNEHGFTCDIAAYIAKYMGIPAFFIPSPIRDFSALYYFNESVYLPIFGSKVSGDRITESLFCASKFIANLSSTQTTMHQGKSRLKRFLRKFLLAIGGQVLLDFFIALKDRNFSELHRQQTGNFPFSFWHMLSSVIYLKRMKKKYNSYSTHPKQDEKFIFYAIHFEPESKTSVAVPIQNQLTIIQMLHNSLPQGWKLYIKEHPFQFMLNTPAMHGYLYNIRWWKSIKFYEEIRKLDNVVFIDLDTPSKLLIEKSQAVATINGTVHLEAVFTNKPCLVFGGVDILLKGAKNIIYVNSSENLCTGLDKIVNNPSHMDNGAELSKYTSYILQRTIHHSSSQRGKNILDSIEHCLAT